MRFQGKRRGFSIEGSCEFLPPRASVGCVLSRGPQKQSDYVTLLFDKTQIFRTFIKLRVTNPEQRCHQSVSGVVCTVQSNAVTIMESLH